LSKELKLEELIINIDLSIPTNSSAPKEQLPREQVIPAKKRASTEVNSVKQSEQKPSLKKFAYE